MTAPRLLWDAAGRPDPRKPIEAAQGLCYWCGELVGDRACRTRDVCSSSFTDHDVAAVPTAEAVCFACTWAMTGRPPDTLRLWSIVYREDGHRFARSHPSAPRLSPRVHLQNKADLGEVDRVLRRPPAGPWVCSVADSGHIHVFPFARVNRGRGRWCARFERTDVHSWPAEYARLADVVQELYDAGYSKDDIRSGTPSPSRVRRLGIAGWRDAEQFLRRYRGGALLELTLFLRRKTA